MKVLITGVTGFVGSHLVDYLLANQNNVDIFGISRSREMMQNISHSIEKIKFSECDVTDGGNVFTLIDKIRPDKIFHLAAQSFVPASWNDPAGTLMLNILGQTNVLEAIRKIKSSDSEYDPTVLVPGSSEEYGLVMEDELPIKETNLLRPLSPYGLSKVCQDLMGYQYWRSHKIKVITTRAFNQSGPRRGGIFVDSNFAKQIAQIEKGKQENVIKVGNLEAARDFTDVRDIVAAYWLAIEKCEPGKPYNICSGATHTIQQVLDKLLSLSDHSIKVEQDPTRMRASDVMVLSGDNAEFKKATGWEPKIDYLNQTLADLLDYWRAAV